MIQAVTGGGFGGKEEYPNVICAHAGLLARKAGRPVKIIYDRHEDMAATTKRHPAVIRHRSGATRDGRLVAQDVEILMDGGAYVTLSPVVLSRGTLHATGPYDCPNVRIRSRVVMTNTPPNGAFRGFGAPQTLFAAEMQMERLAAKLGIDPLAIRRRNAIQAGSTLPMGQTLRESVGARQALEACVKRSAYARRARECARWNRSRRRPSWRGIGLALVHHGAGFTGSGELYLNSRAAVTLTRDGELRVLSGSTEFGQGTTTLFGQIVAETLGVPLELVTVETPDTARVPNSGPTVASRTCMMVGRLLREAALELRAAVTGGTERFPATRPALRAAARRLCGDEPARRFEAVYRKPDWVSWDDKSYTGDAYEAYSYGAMAVELEIDKATLRDRDPRRLDRGRHRHRDPPALRRGPGDRRRDAGARLRAPRVGGLRGRRDEERALHRLHDPDDARHPAHGRESSCRRPTRSGRSARRASASCRWTSRRRPWPRRCATPSDASSTRSRSRPSGSRSALAKDAAA